MMTKTVDAVWDVYLTIWTARNRELYGRDYDEQRAIDLETTQSEVTKIYEESKHYAHHEAEYVLILHTKRRFENGPRHILMHTWQQQK
jgi:hypothetical protein